MKILVDMNLSIEWIPCLKQYGWDTVHWSNIGDPRAEDSTIMHIGRMLNEMAIYSIDLNAQIRAVGIQAFIKKFRENMTFRTPPEGL